MTPEPLPWDASVTACVSASVRGVREVTHTTPPDALRNRSTVAASSRVRAGWRAAGVGRDNVEGAGVVVVVERAPASRGAAVVAIKMEAMAAARPRARGRGGVPGAAAAVGAPRGRAGW
jgi:hypothetical protein